MHHFIFKHYIVVIIRRHITRQISFLFFSFFLLLFSLLFFFLFLFHRHPIRPEYIIINPCVLMINQVSIRHDHRNAVLRLKAPRRLDIPTPLELIQHYTLLLIQLGELSRHLVEISPTFRHLHVILHRFIQQRSVLQLFQFFFFPALQDVEFTRPRIHKGSPPQILLPSYFLLLSQYISRENVILPIRTSGRKEQRELFE